MKLLKPLLTASLLFSLLQSSSAQDEPEKEAVKSDIQIKREQLNETFSNIPEDQRITYLKGRSEAQRLFSKKRTFETLMKLNEIKDIFPDDPAALNILGAVHVEFRDFEYAREVFDRALEIAGHDPKILFNIAEIEFCSNNWETCIKQFDELIKKVDNPSSSFVHLMQLKQLLSYLALARENADSPEKRDEYLAKAIELESQHTYMDDTPFSYYAHAAISYYNEDRTTAAEWIIRAKKVFGEGSTLSWDDTLVEFGYIESHYGLHFSKTSNNNQDRSAPAAP